MSLSLNPAGLVDVEREFQLGGSLFILLRSYTATGTTLVAPGSFDSNSNYFVVPNIAYSSPIDLDSALGLALYGNGGMNTNWPNMTNTTGACLAPPPFGFGEQPGVFCGGTAGIDLMQAFLAVGYAKRVDAFSFSPSTFHPYSPFSDSRPMGSAPPPFSSSPANLTDNGYSYSYGGGVRGGAEYRVAPNFRLGVSAQTPMWMTKFSRYTGLFADSGKFDILGNLTAAIAWDAMSTLTLMADYKHIFSRLDLSVRTDVSVR